MPDDDDPHTYLDMEAGSSDPDLQSLREEVRPPLGERWTSWIETASTFPAESKVLTEVYLALIKPENMPFLQCADVRGFALYHEFELFI